MTLIIMKVPVIYEVLINHYTAGENLCKARQIIDLCIPLFPPVCTDDVENRRFTLALEPFHDGRLVRAFKIQSGTSPDRNFGKLADRAA